MISILCSPSIAAYLIPTILLCLTSGYTMTLRVLLAANILAADVKLLLTWNNVRSKQWLAAWWKFISVLDLSSWLNLKAFAWANCCTPLKSRIIDIVKVPRSASEGMYLRLRKIYIQYLHPRAVVIRRKLKLKELGWKVFVFMTIRALYIFRNLSQKVTLNFMNVLFTFQPKLEAHAKYRSLCETTTLSGPDEFSSMPKIGRIS